MDALQKRLTQASIQQRKATLQAIQESDAAYSSKMTQAHIVLERVLEDLIKAVPDYLREDLRECLDLNTCVWGLTPRRSQRYKKARSERLATTNEL